ncbi:hypothetical protein [Streptomyces sp. ISL-11]|uniref:hypothetical protein n=1 Tax=Streptomyces sp. ISL-11 TaxID=2819174 RepID=UPI001BE728ED|nr:hypothetical protein [Streptomyces sp. ISL-11]MBT2383102.1 hypothetical protein [Streptomyces sp. ISL-11]
MTLTLSAVAILAVAAFFILRSRYVGPGSAIVLFLFGFFTAGTGASGPINRLCAALVHAIPSLTS